VTDITLFPFMQYWWLYLAFLGGVLVLLALDLGVFHRVAQEVSFREAATWSVVWISLAIAFNVGFYFFALWQLPQDPRLAAIPGFDASAAAWESALAFLTGFIVEKSLSVDNIFVFVMIFNYFALPAKYQYRVLFFGILGALLFRAIFIVLGSALLQFHWVVWIFGLFLIASGLKIMFAPEKGIEPDRNPLIRLFRRFVPITPVLHGQQFFVRLNGVLHATPLFVTLLCVEVTDIIFAVDSVPAIYALTGEPLIVFTSNVFAILGLRALYFLLAGMMDRFYMLKYGLAVVLMFVGLKIAWLNGLYGGKFPITISLGIISAVIAASVVLSLLFPRETLPHAPAAARRGEG
jgi:tellurite resistance protein TerC